MRAAAAPLLALACVHLVHAARKSEFRREFDLDKLDKQWKEDDVEDLDWHESSYEWRNRRLEKKRQTVDATVNPDGAFLLQEKGKAKMTTALLKERLAVSQGEELARKYTVMLRHGGVQAMCFFPTREMNVVCTQDDGRWVELKNFLLLQPEVASVRIDDQHFMPGMTGTTPTFAATAPPSSTGGAREGEQRAEVPRKGKGAKAKRKGGGRRRKGDPR